MPEMVASGGFLVHRRISCDGSGWLQSGGAPLARRRRALRGDGVTERRARVWAAFGVRMKVQGSAGWLIKGGSGDLGVRTR